MLVKSKAQKEDEKIAQLFRNALNKSRRKDYSQMDEHKIRAQEIREDK